MSQVAIWAKIPAKPGMRDEMIKVMQEEIDHVTKNEDGTVYYILHHDPKDEDAVYFYELYTDRAASEAHGASDTFKAMGPLLAPFIGGKPELKFLKPVQGKGL
jgi:quinol monooxygenase YgiN